MEETEVASAFSLGIAALPTYMHAAGEVMGIGHGGMDYMLLQLLDPGQRGPGQGGVDQFCGQNLQADRAGNHEFQKEQAQSLLHCYDH